MRVWLRGSSRAPFACETGHRPPGGPSGPSPGPVPPLPPAGATALTPAWLHVVLKFTYMETPGYTPVCPALLYVMRRVRVAAGHRPPPFSFRSAAGGQVGELWAQAALNEAAVAGLAWASLWVWVWLLSGTCLGVELLGTGRAHGRLLSTPRSFLKWLNQAVPLPAAFGALPLLHILTSTRQSP